MSEDAINPILIPTIPREQLLALIKQAILTLEPGATIIMYGSRARQDAVPDSDWDFLILVDGLVDRERTNRIRHRLYHLEWEHDTIISSIIRSRTAWDEPLQRLTPFHQNVEREGIKI